MEVKRYTVLDIIRGFAVLSMIVYHTIWDLVHIFNFNWQWFDSRTTDLWQQVTCCTFILLSGFCLPLNNHKFRRGIIVFFAGAVVSAVTIIAMPENKILFGVLTLLGSCMLITASSESILKKIHPTVGFIIFILMFVITKNINSGYLSLGYYKLYHLPEKLYCNTLTAYLGFPSSDFFSTDYFPLIPWIFLFICGYYLYHIIKRKNALKYLALRLKPIEFIGRHSLLIYMIHQPVIYFILFATFHNQQT